MGEDCSKDAKKDATDDKAKKNDSDDQSGEEDEGDSNGGEVCAHLAGQVC